MNSVSSCDTIRPPTTVMPSGWRSSAPAPAPIAIGSAPSNAQVVVIMMGRKRSRAASTIACSAVAPWERRSIAKSTIMMAFFLTMPISMTTPIMAMTLRSMPNSIRISSAPMPADGRPDRMVSGWMKLS